MSIQIRPHRSHTYSATFARYALCALLTWIALTGCSGGGGGSDSSAPATSVQLGNGFPIGVFASVPMSTNGGQLSVTQDSGLVSALANGERQLDIGLFDLAALFAPLTLQHANCYGPSVSYVSHDDGTPGEAGVLAQGGVGIWQDLESARPCGVAEAETLLSPVTSPLQQSLLLGAALRRIVKLTGSGALPDPSTTRDLTSSFTTSISGWPSTITVRSATVQANSDASVYAYRIALVRGTGSDSEVIEISIVHTPNDTTERFAGVVRLTRGYLTTNSEIGCADMVDSLTGRYRVTDVRTLGYNRFDQFLSLRFRAAHYCGRDGGDGNDHFGAWVSATQSGELDHTVALSGNTRLNKSGWRRNLIRFSSDVDLSNLKSEHLWGWQISPADSASRLFATHIEPSSSGVSATLFHAFGDNLIDSDGVLLGMYCNWNGPNPSGLIATAFQRQTMRLNGGSWGLLQSDIAYGPTNNCQASTNMSYDATGLGTLTAGTGATSDRLARPTNGRTDVQSEIIEQGFWMPLLF